jgi:hypothetical protein
LALAATFGLNLLGIAFTGMEHSLQVLLALTVVYGVLVAVEDRHLPRWLPVALVVAPLIRYETASVSGAAALVLMLLGWRRVAVFSVLGWTTVLAAFSVFLASIGLDPLPSSILAKSAYGSGSLPFLEISERIRDAFLEPRFLVCLVILVFDVALCRRWSPLHLFVVVALGAHATAMAGDGGLLARYELYLWAAVLPVLATLVARSAGQWRRPLPLGAALVAGITTLLPLAATTFFTTAAAEDIWSQQAQTAVFVREHWRHPIAVNDLGLVAYRSDQRILDLWGLASQSAREARAEAEPGWVARMVEQEEVHLVAVYSSWFGEEIPSTWLRVGTLTGRETVTSAGRTVDFYATDAEAGRAACISLAEFAATAPPQTKVSVLCDVAQ